MFQGGSFPNPPSQGCGGALRLWLLAMRPSVAWLTVDPPARGRAIEMSDVWIVLIGVTAGWVLSVFTPPVTRWFTRRHRRRIVALHVCAVLDVFIADCQAAIDDEGERPRGNRRPSVPMPTGPDFPAVDWTSIEASLATSILALRAAATRADHELRYLAEELHDPPDNEPWFRHRRARCQRLLRDADELSSKLRTMTKLPPASDTP